MPPQGGDQSVTTSQRQTGVLTSQPIQKREKVYGHTLNAPDLLRREKKSWIDMVGENAFQSTSKPISKGFYETKSFL